MDKQDHTKIITEADRSHRTVFGNCTLKLLQVEVAGYIASSPSFPLTLYLSVLT